MPHIDELLGVATVAATGLLAAILLQPAGATELATAHASPPTLTVEVVARRTIEQPPSIACEPAGGPRSRASTRELG